MSGGGNLSMIDGNVYEVRTVFDAKTMGTREELVRTGTAEAPAAATDADEATPSSAPAEAPAKAKTTAKTKAKSSRKGKTKTSP